MDTKRDVAGYELCRCCEQHFAAGMDGICISCRMQDCMIWELVARG